MIIFDDSDRCFQIMIAINLCYFRSNEPINRLVRSLCYIRSLTLSQPLRLIVQVAIRATKPHINTTS
jgi:hypothetical protein